MSVDAIRIEREAREAQAALRASTIPPGNYHASGKDVVNSDNYRVVATCETHWDACLVMLAACRQGRD